ncbi:unnamed protein product [Brassica oleracea var. botrytis]|uniref:Uncharacterized protein n=2 Tax=Brassica TaxID=3705 RepID=A0A0D3E164_BRAOL|nr:unnamed protein product [Brassica napus]
MKRMLWLTKIVSLVEAVKKFMFEFGLIAQCVDKDSELADVEAVSAGNNYELGNMIAEAMAKVGCKGVVTL